MSNLTFRTWLMEEGDIFGFQSKTRDDLLSVELDNKPVKSFNTELMMEYLTKKRLGEFDANLRFMNEIQWGYNFGAVKLEVDSRMTFYVKKLSFDLTGSPRWITKKSLQLNRNGYGGHEDSVAQEIYGEIKRAYEGATEGPSKDCNLEPLIHNISNKLKRVSQRKFAFDKIKKMSEHCYQIVFKVAGQGVEAPHQRRVEQNVTEVSYDKTSGIIKATNYNVESPVGGPHEWKVMPSNTEQFFFPNQDRDEISETLAVRFKYY